MSSLSLTSASGGEVCRHPHSTPIKTDVVGDDNILLLQQVDSVALTAQFVTDENDLPADGI